jgi:hypothetical protein
VYCRYGLGQGGLVWGSLVDGYVVVVLL